MVAVSTSVDQNNNPDLRALIEASETGGKVLSGGDIVVFQTPVYTLEMEEECISVVENVSGLSRNLDFFTGYCTEQKASKITFGSTPTIGKIINEVFASILPGDIKMAPCSFKM